MKVVVLELRTASQYGAAVERSADRVRQSSARQFYDEVKSYRQVNFTDSMTQPVSWQISLPVAAETSLR